jgi:hypothetical protein
MWDSFSVSWKWIFGFSWRQFSDFALVNFLRFFDTEPYYLSTWLITRKKRRMLIAIQTSATIIHTDCATKVFHQNLRLFDFVAVNFTSHHRTERHLGA